MTSYKDCARYYSNLACHDNCRYRHEPAALGSTLCPKWKDSWCYDMKCKFRHAKMINDHFVNNELCRHENSPRGCANEECPFRHEKTPNRYFFTGSSNLSDAETPRYTELCSDDIAPGGCSWQGCVKRHENVHSIQGPTSKTTAAPNVAGLPDRTE